MNSSLVRRRDPEFLDQSLVAGLVMEEVEHGFVLQEDHTRVVREIGFVEKLQRLLFAPGPGGGEGALVG